MTSTEKRGIRDVALMREWKGTRHCTKVTVRRDNGTSLMTVVLIGPFTVNGQGAYVKVKGIPGNTALHRVKKGWGA